MGDVAVAEDGGEDGGVEERARTEEVAAEVFGLGESVRVRVGGGHSGDCVVVYVVVPALSG